MRNTGFRVSYAVLSALLIGSLMLPAHAGTPGAARNIDCQPDTIDAEAGTAQTVTCTVTDSFGTPAQSAAVAWSETGPGDFVFADPFTDKGGQALAQVATAESESGTEVVFADLDPLKGECGEPADSPDKGDPAGNCSDSAKVNWSAVTPTPTPTPMSTFVQPPAVPCDVDANKSGAVYEVEDPADVDVGERSIDILGACMSFDYETGTTSARVTLRDTLAAAGTPLAGSVWLWVDSDDDYIADGVVGFHLSTPEFAWAEARRLKSATEECSSIAGGTVLGEGAALIDSVPGGITLTFSFEPALADGYVLLAAYGEGDGAFDYAPEQTNPEYPPGSIFGSMTCTDFQGNPGRKMSIGASEPFDAAIPADFFEVVHGDARGVPIDNPIKQKYASFPKNTAPKTSLRLSVKRPLAGSPIELNASHSKDPDGKLLGIAWDLDGDRDYNDAYGKKIDFTFSTPGKNKVSLIAFDKRGRGTKSTVVVDVRKGKALKPARVVGKVPENGDGEDSFEGSLDGWTGQTKSFDLRADPKLNVGRVLGIDDTLGGTYSNIPVSIGAVGEGWVSSATTPPARISQGLVPSNAGDLATGVIASAGFVVDRPCLHLFVGGTDDREPGMKHAESVQLFSLEGARPQALAGLAAHPHESEEMQEVAFDLSDRVGDLVSVALIDASSQGHINLDTVTQEEDCDVAPPVVHGFFDPHIHLMAHQGFGGLRGIRSYMGVPGGNWHDYATNPRLYDLDVNRDSDDHFGGPVARLMINVVEGRRRLQRGRFLEDVFSALGSVLFGSVGGEFHDTNQGPMHEQMHITEIRRAYEGGLRMISSLAISSAAMEYAMGTPHRFDGGPPEVDLFGAPTERDGVERSVNVIDTTNDKAYIEAHAEGIRELASLNSDWMQVVYSPEEARQAILDDKLAIVLGSEVDTLGNLGGELNTPTGPTHGFPSAEAEVDYLWDMGYRQIQLIHAVDNSIGGASIFQDGYNAANDFLNRPVHNAVRRRIVDDVNREGFHFAPHPSFPGEPKYGYLFDVQRTKACEDASGRRLAPRGECVQYYLDKEQTMVSIDAAGLPGFVVVHPAAARKEMPTWAPNYFYEGDGTPPAVGQTNRRGLSDYGRSFVQALMNRGMIIDIEHSSDKVFDDMIDPGRSSHRRGPVWNALPQGETGCSVNDSYVQFGDEEECFANAYPLMSSHTSFRGQSFSEPQDCLRHFEFVEYNPPNYSLCKTTNKGWVAREFERTPAQIEYIRRSGGTIAPVLGHDPVDDVLTQTTDSDVPDWRIIPGRDWDILSSPANDCAGSSKSWVQAYLYGMSKMRGRGMGLADDMIMVGSAKPRFASPLVPHDAEHPGSCTSSLDAEQVTREESVNPGQYNRAGQTNPVQYFTPYYPPAAHRLRQFIRPNGSYADFNYEGLRTFGLIPDMLEDARNDGVVPEDLEPIFFGAQDYIDMWSKGFTLAGCDPMETNGTCAGSGPVPLLEGEARSAVCHNTCPMDEGRGMSLKPNGTPFRFKAPFDH